MIVFIFIVIFILIILVKNIPKTKKQKLKEEIRSEKRRSEYLLGLNRPYEYHYHNDCELVKIYSKYNKNREHLEFTGPPSVLIGDKISLVWYSDRLLGGKIRRNYFYKDYQINAFEEFIFDDKKEIQINHRIFSKDSDYVGPITMNDFIYIEETFKDGKTIMCRMEVGNIVRFEKDPQHYYTLKYKSGAVMYAPIASLREILVKEVVELKKLFPSDNKPNHIKLSRRKLFFHMVRCRDISRADSQQVIKQVVEEEGDTVKTEISKIVE